MAKQIREVSLLVAPGHAVDASSHARNRACEFAKYVRFVGYIWSLSPGVGPYFLPDPAISARKFRKGIIKGRLP